MKIILTFVGILLFYLILASNCLNQINNAFAVYDVEACTDAQYYSDDMTPCFEFTNCYDNLGVKCGVSRCCEYSSLGSSCNETECIE